LVVTTGFVGSTQVTAFDIRNAAHFDTAQVGVFNVYQHWDYVADCRLPTSTLTFAPCK